jgi:hypothetical protein
MNHKKINFTFLLLIFFGNVFFAQKTREKVLVLDYPSVAHRDGLHQKIQTFPFLISDSVSNKTLLNAFDSTGVDSHVVYALSENDSSKYLAEVMGGLSYMRYYVMRYDANGNYVSVSRYNLHKEQTGPEINYYPGMRMKSMGKYADGKKKGHWKYYDEQGKITKKETYRKGELKKSKEFKHPHRTYLTLVAPKHYTPIPYRILEPGDTTKVIFANDSIPSKHFPIGFSLGMNFVQSDFKNLRSEPWMLGSPINANVGFGEELHIGSREKFFVSTGLYYGTSAFRGTYDTLGNINVNAIYFRYNAIASIPFYKGKHYGIFLNAGATFANAHITALQRLPNSTVTGATLYFEDSRIKQTLISAGLAYDYSRHPNNANYASFLTFKVGYNLTLGDPHWTSATPLVPEPKISLGGFYASISMTIWKARKK